MVVGQGGRQAGVSESWGRSVVAEVLGGRGKLKRRCGKVRKELCKTSQARPPISTVMQHFGMSR